MNGADQEDRLRRPTIGEFNPIEGTLDEYDLASDLTGIFVEPPRGLVVHYAGRRDGIVHAGSLWATQQSALDFFSARVGDGLTELVHRLTAPERDPDLTYHLRPVESIVVGPDADNFALRPRGKTGGAVLVRTPGAELPPADDPGLVIAARLTELDDEMLYEYRSAPPNDLAEDAHVIELHALFAVPPGVASVRA